MDDQRDIVMRVHEVALKGRNRPTFLRALVDHVRWATAGLGVERVWVDHLVVRLRLGPDADWEVLRERLAKVPGAVKFSLVRRVAPEYDDIASAVSAVVANRTFASFRITAHRADKRFPLTSRELNVSLGALVQHTTGTHVNLTHADLEVHVDILPRDAFVWADEEPGLGGLPVGTGGKVAVLMSGGIDSPVAAWRMVRRGCRASLVHFHSFPLVEGRSREKARELASLLNAYQLSTRLYLVPFAPLQQRIILSVPGPNRIVVYRRFMVRIAEAIARRDGAGALVTGESLGQVGSQTLTNMATVGDAATMPVLRPLVGMDKSEIIEQAQRIGTFETSIMPDEDCCTLFVPKSPSTSVRITEARAAEAELDVDGLVAQAVRDAEVFDVRAPEAIAAG
jgi:thiamine biosynthesis protein ThiI